MNPVAAPAKLGDNVFGQTLCVASSDIYVDVSSSHQTVQNQLEIAE